MDENDEKKEPGSNRKSNNGVRSIHKKQMIYGGFFLILISTIIAGMVLVIVIGTGMNKKLKL